MLQRITTACFLIALASCSGSSSSDAPHGVGQSAYELPPDAESLERIAAVGDTEASTEPQRLDKAGVNMLPTTHIFVAGTTYVGEPLPVMALIQSDNADICRHLQQGTMPKDSAMFAAVILQWDGQPFRVGAPYPGQAYSGREQAPYVQGYFRKLDGSCNITPAGETGVGLELNYGALVLRDYTPNEHASADYKLRLEADGEALEGHIDAAYCDAPAFFDNPEVFLLPVDEAQCK